MATCTKPMSPLRAQTGISRLASQLATRKRSHAERVGADLVAALTSPAFILIVLPWLLLGSSVPLFTTVVQHDPGHALTTMRTILR